MASRWSEVGAHAGLVFCFELVESGTPRRGRRTRIHTETRRHGGSTRSRGTDGRHCRPLVAGVEPENAMRLDSRARACVFRFVAGEPPPAAARAARTRDPLVTPLLRVSV